MGPRPPVQRWFTGLLALGLAWPAPAYALRAHPDTAGLEEVLSPSPTVHPEPSRKTGLEEDDDFIFELARSQAPLTADDVHRVNTWIFQDNGLNARTLGWDQHRQYLEQFVAWMNDDERGDRRALDRYPELTSELERFASWKLDLDDPVTVAALAHWLFPRMSDGSHRTAWLVMNILLHRAGYPMIARNPDGHSDDYYHLFGGDPVDDVRLFIQWIREQVARAQATPYQLATAQVTDLTSAPTPYRMLVRPPDGVKAPFELFTTAGPVRIVCQDELAKQIVERLVEEASNAIPGFSSEAVTIELFRPGMKLHDESTHTILVKTSEATAISDSTPLLRRRLATVTLQFGMTINDVLQQALAQWANRPIESIRPFQRVILRGKRLDLYA